MSTFLVTLLRLSLLGGALTLLLWAVSPLLRRWAGQALPYYLWLVVLLRLCLPVGVTLPLPAPAETARFRTVAVFTVPQLPGMTAPPAAQSPGAAGETTPPRPSTLDGGTVLTLLWGTGAAVFLLWYGAGYLRFARRARAGAVPASPEAQALLREMDPGGQVALARSAGVTAPVLIGPVRPLILLPPDLPVDQLRDVLAHELTHARRHDLLYKWLAAVVTGLHWFNPAMLLLRRELARSCELSCDEAATRGMDTDARRHYGETLLALAVPGGKARPLTATLWGEGGTLKERLLTIARQPRRGKGKAALSVVLALTVCSCALVTGAERQSPPSPAIGPDTALPILREVLLGERPLYPSQIQDTNFGDKGIYLDEFPAYYNPDSDYTQLWRFALVDLDGDGETEAVVQIIDAAGDMGGYLVLHVLHRQREVGGYICDYRWFEELKTDGTFLYQDAAGWGLSAYFEFDEEENGDSYLVAHTLWQESDRWYIGSQEITPEAFERILAEQRQKPDTPWYDFTPEEIARVLPGDPGA